MKKLIFFTLCLSSFFCVYAQNFEIPADAVLLESTEFKDKGVPYIIERRYRLASGETMYAYYDVDGDNSVTVQKLESEEDGAGTSAGNAPLLSVGSEIVIPGMAGYREFDFGSDRRRLAQFMKLFKLGQADYSGRVKKPSLSDDIFSPRGYNTEDNDFKLLLDLYDETWVLEHTYYRGDDMRTTALTRCEKYYGE